MRSPENTEGLVEMNMEYKSYHIRSKTEPEWLTVGDAHILVFDSPAIHEMPKRFDNSNYAKCAQELIELNNDGDDWSSDNIVKLLKKHYK